MKDGVIKTVLKRLYLRLIKRRNESRSFCCAKRFIEKGFYYVPYKSNIIKKIDKKWFNIRNLFHTHISLNNNVGGG